ncbi:MAG: sulfite exporter TauE/SafE family protein [Planctomycetes bacterium]|nr:sulfite exporter TauE/SafE family protein [Planctomycetota bacterium]
MELETTLLIAIGVFAMATMYSTVGHGGGSGYLAILAIAALAPEQMRPTALLLNVVVASIATWKFAGHGKFRKDIFFPLICVSIPAAFIGGAFELSPRLYNPIVGIVLLVAAIRLCIPTQRKERTKSPQTPVLIIAGICIGFVSGAIGIGGGIFLSPFVLLLGWTTAKQTAAISAPFILLNSIAGLCGITFEFGGLPINTTLVAPLLVAVVAGGYIGATFGSKKLSHVGLRTVLGVVLLFASAKMLLTSTSAASQEVLNEIKYTQ